MKASLELIGLWFRTTITSMVGQTLMMLESLCQEMHEDKMAPIDFNSMSEKVYLITQISKIKPLGITAISITMLRIWPIWKFRNPRKIRNSKINKIWLSNQELWMDRKFLIRFKLYILRIKLLGHLSIIMKSKTLKTKMTSSIKK